MNKKLTALLLAMIMVFSLLAACTPAEDPEDDVPVDPGTTEPTTPDDPEDPDPEPTATEKVYRDVFSSDIATLNAQNDVTTNIQVPHDWCSSPLYRLVPTEDGSAAVYVGDIASGDPYLVDDDGYVWQIDLREDATWHNGDPINADTFIYTYKMFLDPLLVNAMANFLYNNSIKILNAEEYYKQASEGTEVAWEDVGIKKVGDFSLQITTTQRATVNDVKRHFVDRSTFPVYEPYYEAGMNADRTATTYGTTLDQWMGAGPYFFEDWQFGAQHVYVKNPDHWMADYFHYDRVEIRVVPDANAQLQMWENGELDVYGLSSSTLETYRDDPRTYEYDGLTVVHMDINSLNTDNPILTTQAFRKAMYYALDRDSLAEIVGGKPASMYINAQAGAFPDQGITYRETPEGMSMIQENNGYDPVLAKQYFDEAMAEVGETSVSVSLMYSDSSEGYKLMSEFLQQSLPEVFGADQFELTLRPTPSSSYGASKDHKTDPLSFDLAWGGWGSSLSRYYPYTAFRYNIDAYASRPNSYISADFDAQYAICDTEEVKLDPQRMVEETKKLEEIYLRDNVTIPVYQSVFYTMYSEKLILPVDSYIVGLGFGTMFADVAVD